MTQAEFTGFMSQRGAVGDGKTYCGSFNNLPFTAVYIRGKSGGKTSAHLQIQFGGGNTNKLFKELRTLYGKSIAVYNNGANPAGVLALIINGKTDAEFTQTFDALLASIANLAPQYQLGLPATCPLCKAGNCDSFALYNGYNQPVHAACVQNYAQKTHSDVQDNVLNGNYLLGFVGALLGGLVGAIIPLLLLIFADYVIYFLFILVPVGAYTGYKLFKGKRTKVAIPIIIVASLLLVPIISYLWIAGVNLMHYSEWPSISDYVFYLTHYSGAFREMLLVLLFVGLGIIFSIGIITRTGTSDVKVATLSASSLRPMSGVAAPQATPVAPIAPAPQVQAAPVVPPVASTTPEYKGPEL